MQPNDIDTASAGALSDVIKTLPLVGQLISEARRPSQFSPLEKFLEKCQKLFKAEACAIFIVREGLAELEAQRGYTYPGGTPSDLDSLRTQLTYRVDSPGRSGDSRFDGITGWIASNGKEFCADSWEEIRTHPSHTGKPDSLKVWEESRPFRCMFAVPLKLYEKTIGILKVENKLDPQGRGLTFGEMDKQLMRTLADCLSMSIENVHLRAELGLGKGIDSDLSRNRALSSPSVETLASLAERLDHSGMANVIERTPMHIEIALQQALPTILTGSFDQLIIAGMGGSALPAELVMDAFSERIRVPVRVIRHYVLPPPVNEKTLVIVSSFSGNTEETLSVVEPFPAKAPNLVVITAGGRLAALANERAYSLIEVPYRREPKGFQPRSAVGYFATYFARVLGSAGLMDDPTADLESVIGFLRGVDVRPVAEEFARWLGPRIPLVYVDEVHRMSIARTAKIKFNENSKRPAFFNGLPETNHNEMIGFSNKRLGDFGLMYLHDPASHPRIRERFNVMKEVFLHEGLHNVAFREWEIPGETKIQRIFAAINFADWCSYTLALLDGVDPTPVALVESFKQVLAEQ